MRILIFFVALALGTDLSANAKPYFALFNGLPVDSGKSANSAEGYGRVRAALARGESQHLIVEYLTSGKGNNIGRDLTIYNQVKNSTHQSFDPAAIEQTRDYSHLPMSVVRVSSGQGLEQLMRHPQVKTVYEDALNQLFLNESLPLIRQPATANQGYTGQNTAIAILDSGVDYTLPAFGSCGWPGFPSACKVAYAQDFAPYDGSLDDNGHGTNVAGIALGVAPDTSILALDVFGTNGAWDSDIIHAINWSISNQATYNIVAINMSLGSGRYFSECSSSVFGTPISAAKAAGIFVAAASGNDGYKDSISSPACVPDAISVGAVYDSDIGSKYWSNCIDYGTDADQVTCFSNSALFLDILAPGAMIAAAGITQGGTSQAAPHVAGAAAVLAQAFPTESADHWLSRLKNTGVGIMDDANGIIKSRIDIYEAVNDSSNPCVGDVLDINSSIYSSGDIKDCTATSRITLGPDITAYSGAAIYLTTPILTIGEPVSIAQGAIFSVNTPVTSSPITNILNDTGIRYCINSANRTDECPQDANPGQDGDFGRDVTHNDDTDGYAGFSFTKLDGNGNPLPPSATNWSCVQDNVTGLIWEVKTDDGGLQDRDNTYSWYNSDSSTNGGDAGTPNGGVCVGSACDIQGYVLAVNTQNLCGHNDWRMPTSKELESILHLGLYPPTIDSRYFPNTISGMYWSGSPNAVPAPDMHSPWAVEFYYGATTWTSGRDAGLRVRLVRGEQ